MITTAQETRAEGAPWIVLTLWQPWASLVALGLKRIETRSWQPMRGGRPYRGALYIHAAKACPDRLLRFAEPFLSALWSAGITPDVPLPTGAIIGRCVLFAVAPTTAPFAGAVEPWFVARRGEREWRVPPPEPERSFGNYSAGRFAWLLDEHEALREPIPARGYQKLWTYTPPPGVVVSE